MADKASRLAGGVEVDKEIELGFGQRRKRNSIEGA